MTASQPSTGLPLQPGDSGLGVRDLQQRLQAAGHEGVSDNDLYDEATEAAVRAFQEQRGLMVDGICARQTWAALIEADYRLGDRMIYLRSPMTRGDDTTDLQRRLGTLGFDAGWVDGIFGPETERAVREYQRNQGLTADGVVGRETVDALERLSGRSTSEKTVAEVREVERLRNDTGMDGRRLIVGEAGGLPAIVDGLARRLRLDGAEVLALHQPDPSQQARAANAWGGSVYVGLTLAPGDLHVSYFEVEGFSSHGGKALAEACATALGTLLDVEIPAVGKRLPILRETRMPAVWCRLGPAADVVEHAAAVTTTLRDAVHHWCTRLPDEIATTEH